MSILPFCSSQYLTAFFGPSLSVHWGPVMEQTATIVNVSQESQTCHEQLLLCIMPLHIAAHSVPVLMTGDGRVGIRELD